MYDIILLLLVPYPDVFYMQTCIIWWNAYSIVVLFGLNYYDDIVLFMHKSLKHTLIQWNVHGLSLMIDNEWMHFWHYWNSADKLDCWHCMSHRLLNSLPQDPTFAATFKIIGSPCSQEFFKRHKFVCILGYVFSWWNYKYTLMTSSDIIIMFYNLIGELRYWRIELKLNKQFTSRTLIYEWIKEWWNMSLTRCI